MTSPKEAVIFIPGFYAKSKDYFLNNFLALGLISRLEAESVELLRDDVKIAGQTGKRFLVEQPDSEDKVVDIYEVYWTDLVDKLSERSAKEQIIRGLFVFIYWLFSRTWQMARKSRLLFFQFMLTLSLLLLWYYGCVAIGLTAIGQNPSAFGLQLPADWAQTLQEYGKLLGGWKVWAIASVLLSLLPLSINSLVDYTDFIIHYLQDDAEVGFAPVRDRIRQRVVMTLEDVLKEDSYEKVTILAHSFGVIVGIDLLADYSKKINKPLRFISMGGPVELLSYKSDWIREETAKCLNNPAIVAWHDYYSLQDWLCTKTPVPESVYAAKFEAIRLQFNLPFLKQMVGNAHAAYFFERSLLERLLHW